MGLVEGDVKGKGKATEPEAESQGSETCNSNVTAEEDTISDDVKGKMVMRETERKDEKALETEEWPNSPPSSPKLPQSSAASRTSEANIPKDKPQSDSAATKESPGRDDGQVYYIKRIKWEGVNGKTERKSASGAGGGKNGPKVVPIVTQNENGPCPLIAIVNVLLLRGQLKLSDNADCVSFDYLLQLVTDRILSVQGREGNSEEFKLNLERNIEDAFAILPKLNRGLDVNVKFTGIADFEYTTEFIIFDILDIDMYHGWIIDKDAPETAKAVGKLSYNQLVEKIINAQTVRRSSLDAEAGVSTETNEGSNKLIQEGLLCADFLEKTASQLTFPGLYELNAAIKEGQLAVLFRNNHFSTLYKTDGRLFLLLTDYGFLREPVVWEVLDNIDGDGDFVDGEFKLVNLKEPQPTEDADYLLALSLQEQDLQERENRERNAASGNNRAGQVSSLQANASCETPTDGSVPVSTTQSEQDMMFAMRLQEEEQRQLEEERRKQLLEERRREQEELLKQRAEASKQRGREKLERKKESTKNKREAQLKSERHSKESSEDENSCLVM
eukprot:Nk52_evm54s1360 gene=Nk52_evmTU54s1360